MDNSQLTLQYDYQTSDLNNNSTIFSSLNFVSVTVHDRFTQKSVQAFRFSYAGVQNTKININIISDVNGFVVPPGSIYLDTVHYGESLANLINQMGSPSLAIDIFCYINPLASVVINSINNNFKTIINSYIISDNIFRKPPDVSLNDYTWISYDPSVSMYCLKNEFVFEQEVDYSNVSECYYRTSPFGTMNSLSYSYANSSTLDICSHPSLQKEAQKKGNVCACPFSKPISRTGCPCYKEDKFKLSTLELFSHTDLDQISPVKTITCYIIRTVKDNDYSLLFFQKDSQKDNQEEVLLKKLVYKQINFKNIEEQNKLLQEARHQLNVILSDYASDSLYLGEYTHKIINHVNTISDLKEELVSITKKSYLTNLMN